MKKGIPGMDGKAYRKLAAWQKSMELVDEIYRVVRELPTDERFGLCSQLTRAAVSVPSNIAEGYGREHRGDYVRHLSFARGSLMEIETQLIICARNHLERQQLLPAWHLAQETGKLLTTMIRSLSKDRMTD